MNDNEFLPFKNKTQETTIGPGNGITFENLDTDTVSIYGDMEISLASDEQDIDDIINILNKIKKGIQEAKNKPFKKSI